MSDVLRWCDDVHIVDSGSQDNTAATATAAGAAVSVNPFQSFGQQRNWALDHCPLKHDWVLFLDADERITPALLAELADKTAHAPDSIAGYYCCWALMLGERWLKRADNFPKWQFRLLRRGRARFTDFGHGQKEDRVDGEIGYIKEPYLHYAFGGRLGGLGKAPPQYAKQEAAARLASDVRSHGYSPATPRAATRRSKNSSAACPAGPSSASLIPMCCGVASSKVPKPGSTAAVSPGTNASSKKRCANYAP